MPHRVSLQARTVGTNAAGEPVENWGDVGAAWANVHSLTGREVLYAAQIQAEASAVVAIYWRPGVDRTMRVQHGGRTLYINAAIDPDGLRTRLDLYCTEFPSTARSAP